MRIHELLEACVEYVAIDGVLGSDPHTITQHLKTLDKTIDDDFFQHIYRLLVAHASIEVILTKHPLPSPDGYLQLGTAPLPIDFDVAEASGDAQDAAEGLRGRALAFHNEGKDFKTDKEAIAANKEAKRQKAKELKGLTGGKGKKAAKVEDAEEPDGEALLTFIGVDDGGQGDQKISKDDLAGLVSKWGSRLRIRATDEEIYYRLTGSRQKARALVGRLSPIVFHTLQLAAKTRDKGISAIELGPAVGTSQGSMHYFMKVLCQLGLCAKVPVVTHSSVTSLLIFHRFLEQNAHYRASMRLTPLSSLDGALATSQQALAPAAANPADDEEADEEEDEAVSPVDPAWNLSFGPMSEEELMIGHLVKERLVKLLEYPSLKNHLLKRKNLLQLLGWRGPHVLRHRRAIARHVDTLQHTGVIEVVEVGERHIRCLRLTKYNPESVFTGEIAKVEEIDEDGLHTLDDGILAHSGVYQHSSPVSQTLSIEYQINDAIGKSGIHGLTIADVRQKLDYYFKRNVEFHFVRSEHAYVPPQNRDHQIVQTMDSHGRERRLRAYSLASYRQWAQGVGLPIDDTIHPPLDDQVGRWVPLTLRTLYDHPSEIDEFLDNCSTGVEELVSRPKKNGTKRKPRADQGENEEASEDDESSAPKKAPKYENAGQIRGRPRKYIHVVDEEGKVRRNIIGSVFPHPDLDPIYVWITKLNKLVPAPPGYSGVGPPPIIGKDELAKARSPQSFAKYPKHLDGKKAKAEKKKGTAAKKPKVERKDPNEADINELDDSDEQEGGSKPTGPVPDSDIAVDTAAITGGRIAIDKTAAASSSAQPKKPRGRPRKSTKISETASAVSTAAERATSMTSRNSGLAAKRPSPGAEPIEMLSGTRVDRSRINEARQPVSSSVAETGEIATSVQDNQSGDTAPALASLIPSSLGPTPPSTPISQSPSSTLTPIAAGSQVKRLGRKPKYTPQEMSIPVFTPNTALSGSPAPLGSLSTEPIVVDGWNSSVLLPKSQKRHPVFQKSSAPKSGSPATHIPAMPAPTPTATDEVSDGPAVNPTLLPESAESAESQQAAQSPLLRRAGRKRKASPIPETSTASVASTPSKSGKRSKKQGAASPAVSEREASQVVSISQPDVTAGEPEVPREWLDLRSKMRHQEAEKAVEVETTRKTDEVAREAPKPNVVPQAKHQTPAANPTTARVPETTPLREIALDTEPKAVKKLTTFVPQASRMSKIDIGQVRRSNEILQTLRDTGEILELNQFRKELWEWHKRVAGTDHPFAPAIATQMDRSVFHRALNNLLDEGKVKMTIATFPTITGGIRQAKVYWLPEASSETTNRYIRNLGQTMTLVYGPKSRASAQIAATEFTEVRPAGSQPGRMRKKLDPNTDVISQSPLAGSIDPEERRAILLADTNVVPILYGYHSGRNARIATMHAAIVNVFNVNPQASSVVATSPRVFGLEMMFSDIPAVDWFRSVSWPYYNEELVAYVGDPETGSAPISKIPVGIRPKQGFGGHYSKQKMVYLLSNMVLLKLIEPLILTDEADSTLVVEQADKARTFFKPAASVSEAMFFRLYESAPVYHIASDAAGFAGLLPVQTADQAREFWKTTKEAATNYDINALPNMERRSDPSRHAPLTDTLEFSSAEAPKLLRAKGRWRSEVRPVEVQRSAIEGIIDYRTASCRLKTDEELDRFAWEWCLPPYVVKETIKTRLDKLRSTQSRRYAFGQNYTAETQEEAERRQKASSELTAKIAEIRLASRLEWERRVEAAAERTGTEPGRELEDYLAKYIMTATRVTATDADGLADEALDEACRMFCRSKAVGFLALPEQRGPMARRAPISRKTRKDKRFRGPKPHKVPGQPAKRNRQQWSEEDEETLLECEAIIRARFKDKSGPKPGRQALFQVLAPASLQVYLKHLRKYLSRPGKQTYFDRITDAYHDLWLKHRGTEALPDANLDSPHDFDLQRHLDFLRANIPLSDIWESVLGSYVGDELKTGDLPEEVESLIKKKDWEFKTIANPTIGAVWDPTSGDDLRAGKLNLASMIAEPSEPMYDIDDPGEGKVKSLIKMIVNHPVGDYHVDVGTRLSAPLVEHQESSISELIDDKVIRRAKAAADGRVFHPPVAWLQASEGPFSEDFMHDADSLGHRLDEAFEDDRSLDWPLLGKNGDIAALLNMVSNDEVDFDFECNEFPTTRYWQDTYNTRKLNDVDLEFEVSVRRVRPVGEKNEITPPSVRGALPARSWQIEEIHDESLVDQAINAIRATETQGITKPKLQDMLRIDGLTLARVLEALPEGEVFWAGYDTARIVHSSFWSAWALPTRPPIRDDDGHILGESKDAGLETLVVPRKWTTVWGERVDSAWAAAKRNVIGWIVSRPGCSERSLRNYVGKTLDRLEFNEVLQNLLDEELVSRKGVQEGSEVLPPVEATDRDEETGIVIYPRSEQLWQ